ncbi:MAG: DUF4037 domain-containing protein [Mycobacteriales bacterium]
MSSVKGLDLARAFYTEVVGPALHVPHSACLIGEGSEVLGYDTPRSTDHEWGPRLQILVEATEVDPVRQAIDNALPETYRGYPTRWYSLAERQAASHVEVDTAEGWLKRKLPTIPFTNPDTAAWLATPQQHLLQLTSGEVFHDDNGVLTRLREAYQWYPLDIWRWIIASQWHLIGNTEPLRGRAIEIGDHRGARIHTGKLCRLIMEMGYLQERRYRPYDKWFGRGFTDLTGSTTLGPVIDAALTENPTIERDGPLQQALLTLGERHNALGISAPVSPAIDDFAVNVNDAVRPYPVLNTAAFIAATAEAISHAGLRNLPRVGAIDQLTHVDDALINFSTWPRSIADIYRTMLDVNGGE